MIKANEETTSPLALAFQKELAKNDKDEVEKILSNLNSISREAILSKPMEKFVKVSMDDEKSYMYSKKSGMYEEFNESIVKRVIEDEFKVKSVTPGLITSVARLVQMEMGNNEYKFKFDKKYIAMKLGTANKYIWIHLRHEFLENGEPIFRVYAKSMAHACKTFYEGFLSPSQVKCLNDDKKYLV